MIDIKDDDIDEQDAYADGVLDVDDQDGTEVPPDTEQEYFFANTSTSSITGSDNNYCENGERASFSAETSYQDTYLQDIYNTEEHYHLEMLKEKFHDKLKDIVNTDDKFSFIKSYDITLLGMDDEICVDGEKDTFIIQYVFDDNTVFISSHDKKIRRLISFDKIRPLDKQNNKFNNKLIYELYNKLDAQVNDKGVTGVEFFSIFSGYFKIAEQKLFNLLSENTKQKLLQELRTKTNNKKLRS